MDQDPATAYLAAHILTAPPSEQLLLTYEAALREVERAREAWVRGDPHGARAADARLTQLLLLLLGAVDPGPDPVVHQAREARQGVDGRVDPLPVERAAQDQLTLRDVAGQVGDGVGDVVVRHGEDGE